jgi:hypothetical protein
MVAPLRQPAPSNPDAAFLLHFFHVFLPLIRPTTIYPANHLSGQAFIWTSIYLDKHLSGQAFIRLGLWITIYPSIISGLHF